MRKDLTGGVIVDKASHSLFCDGAHMGSGFTPVKYEASKNGSVWFCGCGCKTTGGAPL